MRPLSPETQTLYAELLERLRAFEATRSFASLPGSFTRKHVKQADYWYFKTSVGPSGQKEFFVGPDTPEIKAIMEAYSADRPEAELASAQIDRLCAMLRHGGAQTIDTPSARVISGLASAGIFRLDAVLVGTNAYVAIGNALGVQWSSGLRTQDIDLAAPRILELAVQQQEADLPKALDSLNMGFLPIPGFDPREPATSFHVRGKAMRVDLLTPAAGRRTGKPVRIERFKAAAQPLEFLHYILESTLQGAIINGGATLVNLPDPARFAIHKLVVAGLRPVAFQSKSVKDRQQAAELIEALYSERRGDLTIAVEALNRETKGWRVRARRAVAKLPDSLAEARKFVLDKITP
jgi:hypothetical protein